jgi:beta-glucosidase
MSNAKANGKLDSQSIELTAGQSYKVSIEYHGQDKFTLGWETPKSLFNTEQEYLTAAKNADAVIYFGGLSHADDREAIDRIDMKLPNSQDEVINKLLTANNNTIVFLIAGSAVEMPWADRAKAIVWGWYGGMEAGNAFANILSGEVNPSGKLPITLPEKLAHTAPIALDDYNAKDSFYKEGVFIGHRWFEQQNIKPSFPFGFGLSYTEFAYSDIKLSSAKFDKTKGLIVEATITNTGKVAGSEAVQLYLHDKKASVERPYKELKGFAKVNLKPGESKTVKIALTLRDLSFWDIKTDDWLAEKGEFEVLLGASSQDIRLTESFAY